MKESVELAWKVGKILKDSGDKFYVARQPSCLMCSRDGLYYKLCSKSDWLNYKQKYQPLPTHYPSHSLGEVLNTIFIDSKVL